MNVPQRDVTRRLSCYSITVSKLFKQYYESCSYATFYAYTFFCDMKIRYWVNGARSFKKKVAVSF